MINTPVAASLLMSMLLVASFVLGVLVTRRRDHGPHRRRSLERTRSDVGSPAATDDASDRPVSSTPPIEAVAEESAEALDRLRCWVEACERLDRSTVRPMARPLRSKRQSRARNRTVRLARRHRPAWSGANSAEPVIRVLGRVRVEGSGPVMTSQQQAMVAMLGLHGPCDRDHLINAMWGGRAISDSRFANLLAEVRAAIGRHRLVQNPDGRYELLDVAVDVARFTDLVEPALAASVPALDDPGVQDALDRLELAIGLIDGPVLESGRRRFWGWLDDGYHRRYEIEQLVVSAGLRAAVLALAAHQAQRARWACERCLVAVPHDERLVTTLAEIHLAQGRQGAAADLVAGWEQAVRRLGLGEPSSEPRDRLVVGRGVSVADRSTVGPQGATLRGS